MLPLVLVLAPARSARAQDIEGLIGAPGSWRRMTEPSLASNVSRASAREMLTRLDRILGVLRATPVLSAPRGFVVAPSEGVSVGPYSIEEEDEHGYGRGTLVGYASITMLPLVRDAQGKPPRADGEGPSFTVDVNSLKCLYPGWKEPYASDSLGGMYVAPERASDVHGHPAYTSMLGQTCVVVTSRPDPLYVPVSRERLLRALIAQDRIGLDSASEPNPMIANLLKGAREFQRDPRPEVQKREREMEANIRARMGAVDSAHAESTGTWRRRLASHQQLLARMSSAERAAPAVVSNFAMAEDPFTADPEHPFAATALVTPNPGFFPRGVPVSAVHVLTFFADCKAIMCSAWGSDVRERLLAQMNWAALEAVTR